MHGAVERVAALNFSDPTARCSHRLHATRTACCADTLHANLLEVKDLFEVKRFALFDQVGWAQQRLWVLAGAH